MTDKNIDRLTIALIVASVTYFGTHFVLAVVK